MTPVAKTFAGSSKRLQNAEYQQKVVAEQIGVVPAKQWLPAAAGELVEEVIGLGRYGKTLTVLSSAQGERR